MGDSRKEGRWRRREECSSGRWGVKVRWGQGFGLLVLVVVVVVVVALECAVSVVGAQHLELVHGYVHLEGSPAKRGEKGVTPAYYETLIAHDRRRVGRRLADVVRFPLTGDDDPFTTGYATFPLPSLPLSLSLFNFAHNCCRGSHSIYCDRMVAATHLCMYACMDRNCRGIWISLSLSGVPQRPMLGSLALISVQD